ncbi:MAG: hypothetical protein JW829_00705 [Pirellulales bacterium]|nr:hypothetical protein [Pirellulales bacterium]
MHRSISLVPIRMLPALILMVGCGDSLPKRVPVSGQVLIDHQPLTQGSIRLVPKDARPATGKIGPDGRFTLTTFGDEDGVVLGTHRVAVNALEILSANSQRWLVPKKYANERTSELTVTIDGPTDSLKVELTWDGGKPFVEKFAGGE